MSAARLWARCIHGLEPLVAVEVSVRLCASSLAQGHRDVLFDTSRLHQALDLWIADDVFLHVADIDGIGRDRASLDRIRHALADVPFEDAFARQRALLSSVDGQLMTVSASFLGRRNFNRYDLEDTVGAVIARRLGSTTYRSRRQESRPPEAVLAWRAHLVDDRLRLGLRLGDRPLHRRPYKVEAPPGTLHPPVAAAMALLAGLGARRVLVDPTCGAGTIAIEAKRWNQSCNVMASDISPHAVAAAARNAHAADTSVPFSIADAARLPLATSSVDAIVANLPWGRQVAATPDFSMHALLREAARVVRSDGRVVVLAERVDDASALAVGWSPSVRFPLSIHGAHPELVAFART